MNRSARLRSVPTLYLTKPRSNQSCLVENNMNHTDVGFDFKKLSAISSKNKLKQYDMIKNQ